MRNTAHYLNVYRALPKVVVASQYMKNLMVQNNLDAAKIEALPYFIPIPDRLQITPVDASCRDIMFAGRLDYEKGIPYLLEALQLIPKPHQLLIAGDGSKKEEYIALAHKLGLADRVKFLGWLSAQELEAAYSRCAVTVMPTIMAEPFGKVGVEAMATGRPVVAFDVGGISDWLKDGFNGFLVSPLDVAQLANRLTQLLQNLQLAARMGADARKYVEDHYTTDRHLDGLLKIFEEAVSQDKTP